MATSWTFLSHILGPNREGSWNSFQLPVHMIPSATAQCMQLLSSLPLIDCSAKFRSRDAETSLRCRRCLMAMIAIYDFTKKSYVITLIYDGAAIRQRKLYTENRKLHIHYGVYNFLGKRVIKHRRLSHGKQTLSLDVPNLSRLHLLLPSLSEKPASPNRGAELLVSSPK